ncbi:MAG: NAD(P)-dependent oxidoreductase [Desulfuromonadales bacterium]|nr:NAD(P)-dependent oxidoreductase [Desulfuromonadales bacterium]
MVREIGFIGLGTVGRHIAANLTKGNYRLTVWDRHPEEVQELEKLGAQAAADPREAAQAKDLVIVILPEAEELAAAGAGEKGFLAGLAPGSILVDMGTHSLDMTMGLAAEAENRRVMFLDAPVWGTKEHAANGLLTILVGGDPALLSRCREAFSLFGLNIIHVGQVGDATRMKFVVNLMQAELMQALAEGLVLGQKLGFTPEKILEVLESGGVASPLFNSKGRAIARGDFTRNLALKYVYEGLLLVRDAAIKANLQLPAAEAVCRTYQQAVEDGRGEEDFSAVIKVLWK